MDPPSQLTLAPGEEVTIPLAGGGAAGYEWTVRLTGDAAALEASVEAGPGPGRQPEPGAAPWGGSRAQQLRVRAQATGEATVHLALIRSFQPEHPPWAGYDIDVTVTTA